MKQSSLDNTSKDKGEGELYISLTLFPFLPLFEENKL